MTTTEFQKLAEEMGATVVFKTAAAAVFNGPRYCVTIEMDDAQLNKTNPYEVSSLMAHIAMLN